MALGSEILDRLPQETQLTLAVATPTGVVSAVGPQQRRTRCLKDTKLPKPHGGDLLSHPLLLLLREREVVRYNALLSLVRSSLEQALAAARRAGGSPDDKAPVKDVEP